MSTALGEGLDLLELFALPAGALDWQESAGCRGHEPEAFFPRKVNRTQYAPVSSTAVAVCAGCPVRVECLLFGLAQERGAHAGVHGGFNMASAPERERAKDWLNSGKTRGFAAAS